jgi:hypothetical protein
MATAARSTSPPATSSPSHRGTIGDTPCVMPDFGGQDADVQDADYAKPASRQVRPA